MKNIQREVRHQLFNLKYYEHTKKVFQESYLSWNNNKKRYEIYSLNFTNSGQIRKRVKKK